jgi:transposase
MEMTCPDCGGKLRFSSEDVAKQRTVRCSGGHSVRLQNECGAARKASKAVKDLEKVLKWFGK